MDRPEGSGRYARGLRWIRPGAKVDRPEGYGYRNKFINGRNSTNTVH